ncbi:alpha/beta hydrolase family domain-containing protein [Trichoderma breve]|uniref:Alpha/beta hydrolase family domain-containing protein n=1 Tax=Trichoderma breve TaxID=2034170 RepID=A0A9W9E8J0_9HYPO|nr:alpha/beta hydrolase family domain-containing protein [Trichoderma breve]KAJ4862953.1 alpha/beta hydrolase family domain-containing protein [Trichoderma breve]
MALMMATRPYPEPTGCFIDGEPCIRTSFKVPAKWPGKDDKVAQMYVECLEPMVVRHRDPVVLIHGDFHHGIVWFTKPDGSPGWAAFFLKRGCRVYVVDLPGSGQSYIPNDFDLCSDFMDAEQKMSEKSVENQLTAPERNIVGGTAAWPTAGLHNKWPGTGQRGDPAFDEYMKSQQVLFLQKAVRQKLAQNGLCSLLKAIGKAILIGQGAGCTAAWLAADAMPEMVAKVVAIEPAGPPAAKAHINHHGGRKYSSWLSRDDSMRKYGLADVPLTFNPPAKEPPQGPALDLEVRQHPNNSGCYMAQKYVPGCVVPTKDAPLKYGQESVPQLVQLKQMDHAVFTAEASSHRMFDWATVMFMRQAGVSVDHFDLAQFGVTGNGHLMFLETNSDEIAAMVAGWTGMPGEYKPESYAVIDISQIHDQDEKQNQEQNQEQGQEQSQEQGHDKAPPQAVEAFEATQETSLKRPRGRDDDGDDNLPATKRLDANTGLQSPQAQTTESSTLASLSVEPQYIQPALLLQYNASYPSPECDEPLLLNEDALFAELIDFPAPQDELPAL